MDEEEEEKKNNQDIEKILIENLKPIDFLNLPSWLKFQLIEGYKIELEHADITESNPFLTIKIVLAHLKECPTYYNYLLIMEKQFKKDWDPKKLSVDQLKKILEIKKISI